jgi:hypothetical protein
VVHAGLLSNLGPAGAYADYRSNRDASLRDQVALIEALDLPHQAQAVMAVDMPHLLGLGAVRLVFETSNLDLRTAPKQHARLSASTAPCYTELVISLNQYRRSAVRGASLKTELTFKDFRNGKLQIRRASQASAVHHFPASKPEQDAQAKQDVRDAFAENLRAFARGIGQRAAEATK